MKTLKIFLAAIILFLEQTKSISKQVKLIYEKDISEHCRRRVMPSIFLGRQVIDANSRILQFSRLDLPYSCYISIRTESGSSMVMMLQVTSADVKESCKDSEQLLVYEMGETFGGYWGPLPDSVMQPAPQLPRPYTLKTTHITTTTTETPPESDEEEETRPTQATSRRSPGSTDQRAGDYVEVEVPLLNVSVHFVSDQQARTETANTADSFDLRNDVTPIEGESYDRSILPLVQFRLVGNQGGARSDGDEGNLHKYEMDIFQDFTPDTRLTLPQLNPTIKRMHNQKYQPTRRLNFKKHRTLFHSQRTPDRRMMSELITRQMSHTTKYSFPTSRNITHGTRRHTQDTWRVIEDLLKKLNKSNERTTISMKEAKILGKISDMDHDQSVYLSSNLSQYADNTEKFVSMTNVALSTKNVVLSMKHTESSIKSTEPSTKTTVLSTKNTFYSTKNTAPTTTNAGLSAVKVVVATKHAVVSTMDSVSTLNNNLSSTREYGQGDQSTTERNEDSASKQQYAIESTATVEDVTNVQSKIEQISKSMRETLDSVHTNENKSDIQPALPAVTSPVHTRHTSDGTTQTNEVFDKTNAIKSKYLSETTAKSTKSQIQTYSSTKSLATSKDHINSVVTGSLVGHESWENLVQAAPEMVVLLNQTVGDSIRSNNSDDIIREVHEAPNKKNMLIRMKKEIHSIPIMNAKPYNVTTRKTLVTTTQLSFDIADMQEFAQLVELQDDELHSRVALRHLHQYVGPPLFNLCDIPDPTKPHVHLFNSSRIVLSPTNFTLDRMVIILTAARALLTGELRCPAAKIECQVAGARVCLDSMVACDAVPNCGSYDIYDEDRLMCGQTALLQHNVYLAAFTFLAVLLTIMYAVHYWLKRCVPQVADAFFVYSDGVENILYLDTIMRSPHDMIEEPKMVYHSHMFGDDFYDEDGSAPPKNACVRFWRKLCCCCRKTRNKMEETETSSVNFNLSMPRKLYSFTELELKKMGPASRDTAVQTGDSLELRPTDYNKNKTVSPTNKNPVRPTSKSYDFSAEIKDSLLTLEEPLPEDHTDELSLLKFFKAARTEKRSSSVGLWDSTESASRKPPPAKITQESYTGMESPSEQELESYSYDRHRHSEPGPSTRRNDNTKDMKDERLVTSTGSVSKHLRFDEVTTAIPPGRYADDDDITNKESRRMISLGDRNRRTSRILDTIEEADEQSSGTKEHRNFWGKVKKPKKKNHVSLK